MINNLIVDALKPCGLDIYFTIKGDSLKPCIVFNVSESPHGFCDDIDDITEYTILLNVYTTSEKYIETINEINNLMRNKGFIKRTFPTARWDDTIQMFNQAMEYKLIR